MEGEKAMEKKKMRCPICAEKMKLESNTFLCQHCGYTLHADGKPISQKISFDYESNHPSQTPRKKIVSSGRFIIKPIGIFVFLYLMASIIYGFLEVRKLDSSTPTVLEYPTDSYNTTSKNKQIIPTSAFFIEFAEQVFQKNITAIQPEEFACITSIRIYRNENHVKAIDYTIHDSQTGVVLFSNTLDYDYADLSCFTGLKSLNLEDGAGIIRKGDFDGLIHLQELQSDKTPSEVMELLPAPEKLKILGIYDNFFLNSLEGIEHFKSLTSLSIDGGSLKTLDGLERLPALEKLELIYSNHIEDFSALYQLNRLKYLSIESSSLKEIGFLEKMPNLKSLSIKDANLLQIEALAFCADSLESLSLWHIYKVDDFSILNTMNQLISLQVELPYSHPSLSFSHMERLTDLSLCRVSDLSSIATALHLQTLKLDGCNGEYLSALTALSDLKSLTLSNLSGYFITLDPLKQISSLEKLTLEDCRIYTNIEEVLTLPNLKEFTIKNCSVGFDFYNLSENNNLEILKIEDTIFAEILPKDHAEYGQIKRENTYQLSDYSDTLKNFPNLIELTLIGNELDDITFITVLEKLQKLNISNNYITDLTPLVSLSSLKTIICSNNPIINTNDVNAQIIQ